MRRYWYPALLVAAAAACDKGSTDSGPRVGSVSLGFDTRTVGVGQEVTLAATVLDPARSVIGDARVKWQTLNPAVASVTQEGVLRGVALGSTQVVASAGGQADTANINVVSGVLRSFNVNSDQACTNPIFKDARQVASSANALIFEDITNPSGGFTPVEYQQIADSFDRLIWPVVTSNFGAPSDRDGNGKVIILYTRAVNELTPANSGSVFGGFYYGRDLYPKTASGGLGACASSNEAEMFYLLAADPNGEVNNNKRPKDQVRRSTQGTVAHELQHLINASRRLFVLNSNSREETWMNEGLSHIAEELVFHAAAGTAPRRNLGEAEIRASAQSVDAFNSYAISNFGRFRTFMETPNTESPIEADDDLETRGSAWHFLRYSADRRAGNDRDVWYALVNTTAAGLVNYQEVFGVEPMDWLRDWTVSVYADDAVPGVEGRFTVPSWNFRSVYPLLTTPARFPLKVDTLVNGTPRSVSVQAASAAYLRFAVPAGGTGDVRLSAVNTAAAGECTPVTLAVGQVYQGSPATAGALCVGEGEYTMIPFFRSQTSGAATQMSVVATGITVPAGPPSPSMAPSTPLFNRSGTGLNPELMQNAVGIEARLRARERLELGRLTPGGGFRANSSAAADPVAPEVRVSLLRTK
jgi:hypothetical protein